MNNVDPDILAVLKTIAANGEALRVSTVKKKRENQTLNRIETQLELLSDELEAVIPKDHPLFNPVLMGAVIRKLTRMQEEKEAQEYKSFLDQFPNGW